MPVAESPATSAAHAVKINQPKKAIHFDTKPTTVPKSTMSSQKAVAVVAR